VMKFVEQDELYKTLLDDVLGELDPVVGPKTGPMVKREAFIFISSPNSVTPYHFDPEHNILLQLRGTKTMTQFPAGDARFAPGVEHERFHAGGHRNLPWNDAFATDGQAFDLAPGQCVYVPVKAPHWVQNGPELSISFSITWRSEWSYAEENAHSINGIMRKVGLDPAMPHRYPRQNSLKSNMYRAVRKLGLGR
jgi:Cupin-like domain